MISMLTVSIGIGLVVSLLFSELFGLAAGGIVVPGYIAMHLNRPTSVLATLGAAVVTHYTVYLISLVVILYGKRHTVLTILIGYLVGVFGDSVLRFAMIGWNWSPHPEWSVIGHIIPGLIAIWIARQGLVETISVLLTASVIVRLVMILIYGNDIAF